VPPGTTKKLAEQHLLGDQLVFSPEFIGEGGYPVPYWEGVPHPTDMKLARFHIFGGSKVAVDNVLPYFQKVSGPFANYQSTDSTTAELVKYMENVWIANKVVFCNEFYDIAKVLGVDYNRLRELWLLDGRVGRSHTLVYPENRGFSGKCIPKDTIGFYRAVQKAGYESHIIRGLLEQNRRWTNPGEHS
jgi:UDPglucose 6-dehydrogenase